MNMYLRSALYTVFGLLVFGVLLFWPAGTFDYWQGWAVIAIFIILSLPYTVYLALKDPVVLERRSRAGAIAETRVPQKFAVLMLQLSFLLSALVAAFDQRFGWTHVPGWLCLIGLALLAIGLALSIVVVLQNRWAAATIGMESDQRLVSSGLYGMVRHPMYFGATLMLVGMPLGLGSYWGFVPAALGVAALVLRIVDEERMLAGELPGYCDYRERVRYRLVPYLW